MKKKISLLLGVIFIPVLFVNAQRIDLAKSWIQKLASPELHGRGYVNRGDSIAAAFLQSKFKEFGLESFTPGYLQHYTMSVNTFPNTMELKINDKRITPGFGYVIQSNSFSYTGKLNIIEISQKKLRKKNIEKQLGIKNSKNTILLCRSYDFPKNKKKAEQIKANITRLRTENLFKTKGLIIVNENRLMWGVSANRKTTDYLVFNVNKDSLPENPQVADVDFKSMKINNYESQNVIGYVKGKEVPDSFIVLTAHYDHLGRMGSEAIFPGANDNASGTSMVLDLARYYASDSAKPRYSMVFMLFSGEEAGLLGSQFNADHPLFALQKTKLLINLDMVGTGSSGITVVNGEKFPQVWEVFNRINTEKNYLKLVAKRGEACNSDHCPFYQKGVTSIFIYAMGSEFTEYHNAWDQVERLPLTKYSEIFKLVREVADEYQKAR